jgi:hypothetical protein
MISIVGMLQPVIRIEILTLIFGLNQSLLLAGTVACPAVT